MRLRTLGTLTAAIAVSAGLAMSPASAAVTLQPGIRMWSDDLGCTTNFVFDGTGAQAGKVFLGTAAHCVTGVGRPVTDEDGVVWGTVAHVGNEDATETDYAFVQVLPGHVGRVYAGVKGYPQFPKGVTNPAQTALGKAVQFSGYGMGFEYTQPTREKRFGNLTYDDAEIYTTLSAVIFGDSGGPAVYKPTGQALGIVSRLCIGLCEQEGPTVQGMIAKAGARGFGVRLRSV